MSNPNGPGWCLESSRSVLNSTSQEFIGNFARITDETYLGLNHANLQTAKPFRTGLTTPRPCVLTLEEIEILDHLFDKWTWFDIMRWNFYEVHEDDHIMDYDKDVAIRRAVEGCLEVQGEGLDEKQCCVARWR